MPVIRGLQSLLKKNKKIRPSIRSGLRTRDERTNQLGLFFPIGESPVPKIPNLLPWVGLPWEWVQVRVIYLETVMPMASPGNGPYFSDIVGVILAVIWWGKIAVNKSQLIELQCHGSLFACWFQSGLISQPTVFFSHNKPALPVQKPTSEQII